MNHKYYFLIKQLIPVFPKQAAELSSVETHRFGVQATLRLLFIIACLFFLPDRS